MDTMKLAFVAQDFLCLFYKLYVSCNIIFELSPASRENKIVTGHCVPVPIVLIFHQFGVTG